MTGRSKDELVDITIAAYREALPPEVDIEADSDFFHVGGTSLVAMVVVGELAQSLEMRVPIRYVFRHPTPLRLADALIELRENASL